MFTLITTATAIGASALMHLPPLLTFMVLAITQLTNITYTLERIRDKLE